MEHDNTIVKDNSPVIYLGPALRYFLGRSQINVYLGIKLIDLSNLFPLLRAGICLKSTLINYINLYFFVNRLYTSSDNYYITPDRLFTKAFTGNIPASFYYYHTENKQIKIPMATAVGTHLVKRPLNSMEIVSIRHKINLFMLEAYELQYIIDMNHVVSKDTDKDEIDDVNEEYSLIKLLSSIIMNQRSDNREINILDLINNNDAKILLIDRLDALL